MNLEHPSWYINEMNIYGGSTEANRKTLHLFTLKKLTTADWATTCSCLRE
jgi:hypothetical protein